MNLFLTRYDWRAFLLSCLWLVWQFFCSIYMGFFASLFVGSLAAFFLLLDFEAINQGIRLGAPENESWRMAFGLLMTLIWIYLEFLRLLAIFTRN